MKSLHRIVCCSVTIREELYGDSEPELSIAPKQREVSGVAKLHVEQSGYGGEFATSTSFLQRPRLLTRDGVVEIQCDRIANRQALTETRLRSTAEVTQRMIDAHFRQVRERALRMRFADFAVARANLVHLNNIVLGDCSLHTSGERKHTR